MKAYQQALNRFIPAFAGNIYVAAGAAGAFTVHPRICGEHPFKCFRASTVNGSSPHLRGTYILPSLQLIKFRFIPAFAGNML